MARRKQPRIPDAILDQLLAGADARTACRSGRVLKVLLNLSCAGATVPTCTCLAADGRVS